MRTQQSKPASIFDEPTQDAGNIFSESEPSIFDEEAPQETPAPAQQNGMEKFDGQLNAAINYASDTFFNRIPGQHTAAMRIGSALANAERTGAPDSALINSESYARADALASQFRGASARAPTIDEIAAADPELAAALKAAQAQSIDLAKAAHGDAPDWGKIQEGYVRGRVAEVGLPAPENEKAPPMAFQVIQPRDDQLFAGEFGKILQAQGGTPRPMINMPQETDQDRAIHNFSEEAKNGTPGLTRPPLSNAEIEKVGWAAMQAQESGKYDELPSWVKLPIRGAGSGGKWGVLTRFLPGGAIGGVIAGLAYEGIEQALGLTSGAQKELEPGKILLSGLMMGAAGKVGKVAEAALPAVPGANTAAQLMTFAAADKALAPSGSEAGQKDERSAWRKLGDYLLETGVMVATGTAVAGKAPRNRPEKAAPETERITTKFEVNQAAARAAESERPQKATEALKEEVIDWVTDPKGVTVTKKQWDQVRELAGRGGMSPELEELVLRADQRTVPTEPTRSTPERMADLAARAAMNRISIERQKALEAWADETPAYLEGADAFTVAASKLFPPRSHLQEDFVRGLADASRTGDLEGYVHDFVRGSSTAPGPSQFLFFNPGDGRGGDLPKMFKSASDPIAKEFERDLIAALKKLERRFTPGERGQPPSRPPAPEKPLAEVELAEGVAKGAGKGLVRAKDDLQRDIAQARSLRERTRLAAGPSIDQYAKAYGLDAAGRDALSNHAHSLIQAKRGTRGSAYIPSKEEVMMALLPDFVIERLTSPNRISDHVATEAAFKALKRSLRSIRIGRGDPPERVKERERQIEDEVLAVDVVAEKAADTFNRALDEVAGTDKQLRALISDVTRKIVETNGAIPVPRDLVPPETLARMVELQRDVGKAGLGYGRLLTKYGLMPPETLKLREQEGVYYPQRQPQFAKPSKEAEARFPDMRGPGGHLENELVSGHLQKRQKTFEEAFRERPLDTSLQGAMEVYAAEGDAIRKKAWLDMSRQDKDVLTKEELPDVLGRERARQRAKEIVGEIKEKAASKKTLDPLQQMQAEMEIAALSKERFDLIAASKEKLWKRLEGKVVSSEPDPERPGRKIVTTEYGDYEGMYIHRDALEDLQRGAPISGLGHVYKEFHTFFKQMNVGFAIHQWLQDWIGNAKNFSDTGINAQRHYGYAAKVMLGKAVPNEMALEFKSLARRAWLGGSGDITRGDRAELRAIDRDLASANEQGRKAPMLRLAKWVASRGKAADAVVAKLPYAVSAPLRVLAAIPTGRQALVDGAQNLSAYIELRTKGVGDSGPLGPHAAFDYLSGITNYQRAPWIIQALAAVPGGPSFIRWSWMVGQATATRTIKRKPSVFGKEIPTPMDTVIAASPGSPAAQAALVGRGLARIGTNLAHWLVPLAGLQRFAASEAGVSMDTLNRELDDKYRYLPGPLAWLVKKAQIPTGRKTPLGRIETVNVSQVIPLLVAMQYFNSSGETTPIWWQVLQKNVIAGPIAQGVAGQDYQAKPLGKGFGIGKRWWPLVSSALPATPLRSLEAYFAEQHVPEEERSVLRAVMRTIVGVPMSVLTHRSLIDKEVERLYEQGTIQRHVGDTGTWYYYVPEPNTVEGQHAQALLDLGKKLPSSLYDLRMHQYRQRENALEKAGVR